LTSRVKSIKVLQSEKTKEETSDEGSDNSSDLEELAYGTNRFLSLVRKKRISK